MLQVFALAVDDTGTAVLLIFAQGSGLVLQVFLEFFHFVIQDCEFGALGLELLGQSVKITLALVRVHNGELNIDDSYFGGWRAGRCGRGLWGSAALCKGRNCGERYERKGDGFEFHGWIRLLEPVLCMD